MYILKLQIYQELKWRALLITWKKGNWFSHTAKLASAILIKMAYKSIGFPVETILGKSVKSYESFTACKTRIRLQLSWKLKNRSDEPVDPSHGGRREGPHAADAPWLRASFTGIAQRFLGKENQAAQQCGRCAAAVKPRGWCDPSGFSWCLVPSYKRITLIIHQDFLFKKCHVNPRSFRTCGHQVRQGDREGHWNKLRARNLWSS